MPIRPTVFIVGAGASAEVGLPIGSQLREQIASRLDFDIDLVAGVKRGDRAIVEAMRVYAQNDRKTNDALFNGARAISQAMNANLAPSIDTFLDHHQNNPHLVTVGKLAIAASILEKEKACALRLGEHGEAPNLALTKDTWYPAFLNLIGTSTKVSELEAVFDSITIVCFNYDRCIEQYMLHAVAKKFDILGEQARSIVSRLKIFHPYGTVGALPGLTGNGPSVPFGGQRSVVSLQNAVTQLRIFTEQWEDKESHSAVHVAIASADALVFLGFGFIPQNMTLLKTPKKSVATDVFLTAHGISKSDRVHVQNSIKQSFFKGRSPESVRFHFAEKCSDIFSEHYHGLLNFVQR